MISKAVAICSGKGGVGKTNVCVNLALALTEIGRKVLLIDLDFGLANSEILLGVKPIRTLRNIKEVNYDFSKIITTGVWGVDFISGGRGFSWLNDLSTEDRRDLILSWRAFSSKYEIILFDTAPSINFNNLLFLKGVDTVVLLSTTEITSLLDTYITLKTLSNVLKISNFRLILNKVTNPQTAKVVYSNFCNCCLENTTVRLGYLGFIPYDERVQTAVNSQHPFYLTFPSSKASKSISEVANLLLEELVITSDEISLNT